MPEQIEADVTLLDGYVHAVVDLDTGRRRALEQADSALDAFFASASAFGPWSSAVPAQVASMLDEAGAEATRVQATAEAFREAEVWMTHDPVGHWRPTDDWVEHRSHRWLHDHQAGALASPVAPAGPFSTLQGLAEAIRTWRGAADDPVVEELLRARERTAEVLDGLDRHFDTFDAALGSDPDGRVSAADLQHVALNPGLFTAAQVLAARALLGQPLLRNRLDTAHGNVDVVGGAAFGNEELDDSLISRQDLEAFVVGTHLHRVLRDRGAVLDTAAQGGEPDGAVSRRDLRRWLEDPANAEEPAEVRDAVQLMLDRSLFDQTWWEENREAVAMGAAVAAGGATLVLTGGTAGPLVVMGAGFVAGATSAAGATVAVNRHSGTDGADGALVNALNGGFVAMAVTGIPAAPLSNGAAAVGGGGADLIVPAPLEGPLHDGANVVSLASGLPAYRRRLLGAVDEGLDLVPAEELAEIALEGLGHGATTSTLRDE